VRAFGHAGGRCQACGENRGGWLDKASIRKQGAGQLGENHGDDLNDASLVCTVTDGRQNVAGTQPLGIADGIINPPIDELLDVVDSKYRLVIMAAKRARQINAYYAQLGEGLLEYVGPLVETRSQEKPLSIALREINERLLNVESAES
jgi:DNA-directed RNA polymerase subunit omega